MRINLFSFKAAMVVTFITMTIAGLWHGATWGFVIFGSLHGIGLVINHLMNRINLKISYFISWFITLNYVNFTLIFFRSENINQSIAIVKSMLGLNKIILPGSLKTLIGSSLDKNIEFGTYLYNLGTDSFLFYYLILSGVIIFLFKNTNQLQKKFNRQPSYLIGMSILLVLNLINLTSSYKFIYFQFENLQIKNFQ